MKIFGVVVGPLGVTLLTLAMLAQLGVGVAAPVAVAVYRFVGTAACVVAVSVPIAGRGGIAVVAVGWFMVVG